MLIRCSKNGLVVTLLLTLLSKITPAAFYHASTTARSFLYRGSIRQNKGDVYYVVKKHKQYTSFITSSSVLKKKHQYGHPLLLVTTQDAEYNNTRTQAEPINSPLSPNPFGGVGKYEDENLERETERTQEVEHFVTNIRNNYSPENATKQLTSDRSGNTQSLSSSSKVSIKESSLNAGTDNRESQARSSTLESPPQIFLQATDIEKRVSRLYTLLKEAHRFMQQLDNEVSMTRLFLETSQYEMAVITTTNDGDKNFTQALQDAKSAELVYGLCSQESAAAWDRVDKMYAEELKSTQCIQKEVESLADISDLCIIFEGKIRELQSKQMQQPNRYF